MTYVLCGRLEHCDSLGSHGIVGPSAVQFMSAGRGVTHSEFNTSSSDPIRFLQTWVLPGRNGGQPLYGQAEFDVQQRRNRWLHIASGAIEQNAPARLTQDATMSVSWLENEELSHSFAAGRLGFLFVADGDIAARVTGYANRIGGVSRISVRGSGEVALWDVPRLSNVGNGDEAEL